MQSMTGYGRSEVCRAHLTLTVEARSVNHRYLDIALRYPRLYAPLEARMKQRVGAYFTRGRIDLTLLFQESATTGRALSLDHALAQQYYEALQRLQASLGLPGTIDLSMITSLRDVFKVEEASADVEHDWDLIAEGLDAALQALHTMRQQEGETLSHDFHLRLQAMAQQLQAIRQRVPLVVVEYRQRLEQRVKDLFAQFELDPNRVAQEAILFAERADITEELTRLEAHMQACTRLLSSSEAVGRKIEFLVQEMHREVNTIGSKSNDTTIAHSVVELKSELERMREQIQNIE
ncbi:MAG TPA: YicC/YloC family endoribonuclease [Candidatus Tectomicrobia bacterium]